MTLLWIIGSTVFISLLSLAGVIALALKEKVLQQILLLLVGFSAGTLAGGAFLHLLPESLEKLPGGETFVYALVGFSLFFLLERILYWRHCHEGHCDIHAFSYLNLFGDGLHNFIDGLVIAGSFLGGIPLGIATTIAVVSHEVPQEIGDFAVLIYGGFSKGRALAYNLLSAAMAVAGGVIGYFLATNIAGFSAPILPITAGGFIYIAASDLIPELHKEKDARKSNLAFGLFILGLLFMWLMKQLTH
ncbi:MAG: ZIP family metal transporter [Candidatus Margulisbacteria bacterium]|jgi:zinc and cadmium transporter|nr:ZIP family metal transporter [Candidatus Margulisiibacteriota bacterium]